MSQTYRVRAVHCDWQADDETVYQSLVRATAPLDCTWERLSKARRIGIKFNQARPYPKEVLYQGYSQELVDPRVARATLRLLRERTHAEIVCTEIAVCHHAHPDWPFSGELTLRHVLEEFDLTCIDGDEPPHRVVPVPGGGTMFRQYLLPSSVADCDAFVSVQKLKNHRFMGVTLCLKNLFGLTPETPHGRSRAYFHHLVRLPYVLTDLGRTIDPALNIVDGLVGQAGVEWSGDPRIGNVLVAGDQVIATDACGTYLMGHDPLGDYPDQPFLRDRNALRVAHESGFGTADLSAIDFESEVDAPVAHFATRQIDPPEVVRSWLRSSCRQALYYRDHREELVARYGGHFILLQDNRVRWYSPQSNLGASRRVLAGASYESALWLKYVDPVEAEGEHFEVYERTLERLDALGG